VYFSSTLFQEVIREAYPLNESKLRKHRIQETIGPTHEGVEGISQNEGKGQSQAQLCLRLGEPQMELGTKAGRTVSPRKKLRQKKHMMCLEMWEKY